MTQHSDSDFDHCPDWAKLMVYYVRRVGETDSQDVYTVFSDHTNDCAVGAKYEWEAISVALFWTLKASLRGDYVQYVSHHGFDEDEEEDGDDEDEEED
ncbi:hypothetical protein DY000_02020464 [Brassica cretica]|uniref:Uncharacterized protein n=1 Tax=Brassica cretica TaxID=69181 RepID=A0ABQ7EHW5_BRACR|nr:hypothetical protein DY000_02020464 [Brassica cretica]